jgi:hypothetical protein
MLIQRIKFVELQLEDVYHAALVARDSKIS